MVVRPIAIKLDKLVCCLRLVCILYEGQSTLQIPTEAAHFSFGRVTVLGGFVALPCSLFDLACFFLPSASPITG